MNQSGRNNPNTVDQVVEQIISELTLEEKVRTANLRDDEFHVLELTLRKYIRQLLNQMDASVNKELMNDCLEMAGKSLNEADAATVILRELWKQLRETHRLRLIK